MLLVRHARAGDRAAWTGDDRLRPLVAPLADARGLELRIHEELGEEQQWTHGSELLRAMAERDVVVCGHGGLEQQGVVDPPRWRKGAVFVVDAMLRVVDEL